MDPVADAPHLSVAIITLNEETRITECLQSLPRGSEVVVLDSGSTDRTCDIARRLGARVETRTFSSYAEQKNAAVELTTRPWVLSLDADEVVGDALRGAIARAAASGPHGAAPAAFRVKRRLVFLGRALRYGKAVDHPIRLFRRGKARFENDIHEQLVVDGAIGDLPGELLHYSYDDLTDYFQRFNDYTTKVAANHARQRHAMPPGALHVLRPWTEFFSRYVLRLGFLDGYPGYTYALLSSLYTYVKYAKLKERLCASGTSRPTAGTAPSPNTR